VKIQSTKRLVDLSFQMPETERHSLL